MSESVALNAGTSLRRSELHRSEARFCFLLAALAGTASLGLGTGAVFVENVKHERATALAPYFTVRARHNTLKELTGEASCTIEAGDQTLLMLERIESQVQEAVALEQKKYKDGQHIKAGGLALNGLFAGVLCIMFARDTLRERKQFLEAKGPSEPLQTTMPEKSL